MWDSSFCRHEGGPWIDDRFVDCFLDTIFLGGSLLCGTLSSLYAISRSTKEPSLVNESLADRESLMPKARQSEIVLVLANALLGSICLINQLGSKSLEFDYKITSFCLQVLGWFAVFVVTRKEHQSRQPRNALVSKWCLLHIFICSYKAYYVIDTIDVHHPAVEDIAFLFQLLFSFAIAGLRISEVPSAEIFAYTSAEDQKRPSPQISASWVSNLTYSWMDDFMLLGYIRPLMDSDIWALRPDDTSKIITKKFLHHWTHQLQLPNPSLSRALVDTHWKRFLFSGILKFFSDILSFVGPQILRLVVEYVEDDGVEVYWGYIYTLLFFVSMGFQSVLVQRSNLICSEIGVQIRAALASAVYKKTFQLNPKSSESFSVGFITNLVSSDAQNFIDLLPYLHYAWSAPLLVAVSIFFLYDIVGYAVFAGLGSIFVMIFGSGIVASRLAFYQAKIMEKKDQRTKILNEVLNGIKIIKLYCWEKSFQTSIEAVRLDELGKLKSYKYLSCVITFVWYLTPIAVTVVTFATYTLLGGELSAAKAFTAIALFEVLRSPLVVLPFLFSGVAEARISLERISDYLRSIELDEAAIERAPLQGDHESAIQVHDASFSWDSKLPFLERIEMKVGQREIVAVVGSVGSGKSSLVEALLGRMEKLSGKVEVRGEVAYVSQRPWIQNASIRDNILFGNPYDHEWYETVLTCCALRHDLDILPAGDTTEIGERGVNLSGGQKQRVSIARAVYSRADVYLLDDPLSAVDVHVGNHIFEQVLDRQSGLLKGKAVLFVTHNTQYLPMCDIVLRMKHGKLYPFNPTSESAALSPRSAGSADSIAELHMSGRSSQELRMTASSQSLDKEDTIPHSKKDSKKDKHEDADVLDNDDDYENGQLISAEDRKFGRVSDQVYMTYAKSFGVLSVTLIIMALLGIQASSISADLWLALWSSDEDYDDYTNLEYVLIYIALGIAQGTSTFLTAFWIYQAGLRTSLRLHNEMLAAILRSPMSFFDTTPIGRILNRFSKDQNIIDDTLPNMVEYYVEASFDLVTAILVLGITIPYMIFVILPMILVYTYLRSYYVSTSRELQRLESISRSPVLSFLAETVNGLSIVNAFGYKERFLAQNEHKLDFNHAAYHPRTCSQRWLSVRLEFIGNIIVTTTFLFVVLRRDAISPGLAGFALKYALSVTECLDWVVQMSCETETNLVAVERVKEFTQLESEGPAQILDKQPASDWPAKGSIEFRNVSLRYREGLDLVLKQVSFEVRPGEKVGICGRTGNSPFLRQDNHFFSKIYVPPLCISHYKVLVDAYFTIFHLLTIYHNPSNK
eukprot:TRINITY_DN5650_c0_g1_i2.p1 TRINITY_DN5650_c0_g1~~TRINITY_DN5650_c0_g1_i2.p1  ORF type:complete len:1307 (-),score=220.17 TRINITY_DN5650_c0_g1_i2:738-4658(-)